MMDALRATSSAVENVANKASSVQSMDVENGGKSGADEIDVKTSPLKKMKVLAFSLVVLFSLALVISSFYYDYHLFDCGAYESYSTTDIGGCTHVQLNYWKHFSWSACCTLLVQLMCYYWSVKHGLDLDKKIMLAMQITFFRFTSIFLDQTGYKFVFSHYQSVYNIIAIIIFVIFLVLFVFQAKVDDRLEVKLVTLFFGSSGILIGVELINVLSSLAAFNLSANLVVRSNYFKMNLGSAIFMALVTFLET